MNDRKPSFHLNQRLSAMSTLEAFSILFLLLAGIAVAVWVFVRGWSPEQLPLWSGWVWGLMLAMVVVPKLLPASIRWSDNVSVAQGAVGIVMLALSIKCLILLIRHGSALSDSQRWAALFGLAPLVIGAVLVLGFLFIVGLFSAK
ncbi:MAG: hypothetical protein JNJ90_18115 [Saprospiraceae bacterium]|jgi:hypothetical protein|nr:hypothetical protein [Saprospiraceae bacterium]